MIEIVGKVVYIVEGRDGEIPQLKENKINSRRLSGPQTTTLEKTREETDNENRNGRDIYTLF